MRALLASAGVASGAITKPCVTFDVISVDWWEVASV